MCARRRKNRSEELVTGCFKVGFRVIGLWLGSVRVRFRVRVDLITLFYMEEARTLKERETISNGGLSYDFGG